MFGSGRPVSLVNGRIIAGERIASSVRFTSRVLALDDPPKRGDTVVDLNGAFVLPGLINAHDHLELNHYGRLKGREQYANAGEWIDDFRPAVRFDPEIRRKASLPLADRLFVGGLKNLLAGVTTVAHHNPMYRGIRRHVPIRVVERFGWAHSFALEREPVGANGEMGGDVRARCAATPDAMPFIVHAGEGIDGSAAEELDRLQSTGCLRANTVLVHGVAITVDVWRTIVTAGTSLVWCPGSNGFLFGRTAPVRSLLDTDAVAASHICLGSDSRVTGSRDLLAEMRVAAQSGAIASGELLRMVTSAPARILKLRGVGRIGIDTPADLIVIPATNADAADALVATSRGQVEFVAVAGRPLIGCRRFAAAFQARRVPTRRVTVDRVERLMDRKIAARLARCAIQEPGLACA